MSFTSKTGLTASPIKKIYRFSKKKPVELQAVSSPAPFILKPFAGLYNPYPYGCSLLCNHPIDKEAKDLLQRAKYSFTTEGKTVLLAEEIAAIRNSLENLQLTKNDKKIIDLTIESSIPEELFRRYTETDSRPLTPALTLASAATRASGSRRCVTPDPFPTNHVREKTMLVLDLRKSHSEETLSWYGSCSLVEPPIIRIQRVPTRSVSYENLTNRSDSNHSNKSKSISHLNILQSPLSERKKIEKINIIKTVSPRNDLIKIDEKKINDNKELENDEGEYIKRRGKRRRRKKRNHSGSAVFHNPIDPETQVSTIGCVSHNPSTRSSLTPNDAAEIENGLKNKDFSEQFWKKFDSFLDVEILKQLRRELNEEIIDNEFNFKRRIALEEALRTVPKNKSECEELRILQKQLNLGPVNAKLWLSSPRIFTRSSSRFELPMDSTSLQTMTPMEYLKNHVSITSQKKLLYNCIFNEMKISNPEIDDETFIKNRKILGNKLQEALDSTMGKKMTLEQSKKFRYLIGWGDDDLIDFKTFCGICALSERLLAPEYTPQLPDRKADPCHEIEIADFLALPRKLADKNVDERLVEILNGIKNS